MTDQHKLGDDIPKTDPWKEDRLRLSPFAKLLSKVIIDAVAPNGYVIGLQGRWGSGKSTSLNFVSAYIKEHNEQTNDAKARVEIVNFRPWIVAGHQDVVAAFFKVLSETLGPKKKWWQRNKKKIGELSKSTTNSIVDAAAKVGIAVDHTGGIASKIGGAAVKATVTNLVDKFLAEPSLQAAYEELNAKLLDSGRKFLVIIDDIDRLEDEEVRSIMQMAKTVGQLPNVIYLLSYDRSIVWRALDGDRERAGPRFAEKIVQQEIDLPRPAKNDLLSLLDQELDFALGDAEESVRWAYIVRDGVMRWTNSPRDIVRLANAMRFSWLGLKGEIDPQDLLAMEGLRLFDEVAFNWARDNRDFLFNDGIFLMSDEDTRAAVGESLKSKLSDEQKKQVLHLVATLFPQAGKWLVDRHFDDESSDDVSIRRGIGCEAGYDAYFSLRPSSDEIPVSTIEAFIRNLDDSDAAEALIRSHLDKKSSRGEWMAGKLLDELRLRYKGTDGPPPTQAVLNALFRIGDEMMSLEHAGGMFSLSPRNQISFLVSKLLDRWGVDDAGAHLLQAFEQSGDPGFCAEIYVDRGRELGVFKGSARENPRITTEDFDKLGKCLLPLIEAARDNGTLQNATFYFDITRSWTHLKGDSTAAKDWLSQGLRASGPFMAKAALGLLTHSVGSRGRTYRMREAPDPTLYDAAELMEAGKHHLRETQLDDSQRARITEVVRGCEVILKGNTLSD